jgi:hypothetical protein
MSGPKVVRIVTREEIEMICRRHIREVAEAAGAFRDQARRYGASDALELELTRRIEEFERLFSSQQWMQIQKRGPETVAFLRAEGDRLREAAVVAAAAARSKRRRLVDGARSISMALEAAGRPIDVDLREVISGAMTADEKSLAVMQSVVNRALASFAPPARAPGPSAVQRGLADRLGDGSAGVTLTEWLASRPAASDHREARLDALLGEIEAIAEPQTARGFIERANAIAQETSSDRRALLTDSLTLDVARHAQDRREGEAVIARLRQARAALAAVGTAAADASTTRITAAIDAPDLSHAERLIVEAEAAVEAHTRVVAAAARRQAILRGLATLGYEVRETMATVWARDGRLVVRKPGVEDYGVELGAPVDASRLQVRVVGSDRPVTRRDATRDRDQETIWCGQFNELRAVIAAQGGEIVLERALEPGAQPVKTVAFEHAIAADRGIQLPSAGQALR